MKLEDHFDCVIMVTASNWFTEARSNRYHYATRFAQRIPVYFLQFDSYTEDVVTEDTGIDNLTVVHMPASMAPNGNVDAAFQELPAALESFMARFQFRAPLIWSYNPFSRLFLEAFIRTLKSRHQPVFTIYHATENYLYNKGKFVVGGNSSELQLELQVGAESLAKQSDMIIAVSDGVRDSIQAAGIPENKIHDIYNGCDAEFWIGTEAYLFHQDRSETRPAILYQGGINKRLDFPLIHALIHRMSDWDFYFCGNEDTSIAEWALIKTHPNVFYLGNLTSEDIAKTAKKCRVGLVPFIDEYVLRTSYPLKMFEYVACGLPVVSTPIDALAQFDQEIFSFADGDIAFESAIRELAPTRNDPVVVDKRIALARANGYDQRFAEVERIILNENCTAGLRKNILVLYDDRWSHIKTLHEHVSSFRKHSRNRIFYAPATVVDGQIQKGRYFPDEDNFDILNSRNAVWDFEKFDAIVIHYSVRLSLEGYVPPVIAAKVRAFRGEKILFIQDEYENTETAHRNMEYLGITTVFSCVPPESQDFSYPYDRFPDLERVQTLTGYVPEDKSIESAALPIEARTNLIGYRGRKLPHHYGMLGFEKFQIGVRMREEADKRNLSVDIEWDDTKRIYGSWYQFLGSCRATLGTESGCNIFDFDGGIKKLAETHADRPFEEVYEEHFAKHENLVRMNQISPKFFEAIRLRTALICFPGTYSGILRAGDHFIELAKDYSNVDEVFEKLQDVEFIKELTDRAYEDVIASGKYSYAAFINEFDTWLDDKIPTSKYEIISAPIAVRRGRRVTPIHFTNSRDLVLNTTVLNGSLQRMDFVGLLDSPGGIGGYTSPPLPTTHVTVEKAKQLWSAIPNFSPTRPSFLSDESNHHRPLIVRMMPLRLKSWLKSVGVRAELVRGAERQPLKYRLARRAWRILPSRLKRFVGSRVFSE
ncbi:glycosyltransferase [Hoeflea sp. YIM 152468]|uniref:glycosyltransferase n=1 Tax=Hoeflea sp. YIM 152468 TaxID=3031759 RepID=UPI0023D9793B|nr:glycosyltransferase [Hoeflea sp. YIM 152468]MDF1610267.1 glycosyltransferase [Hoeflea sp. YIM 152468]